MCTILITSNKSKESAKVTERDSSLQFHGFFLFIADETGTQQSLNGKMCIKSP